MKNGAANRVAPFFSSIPLRSKNKVVSLQDNSKEDQNTNKDDNSSQPDL